MGVIFLYPKRWIQTPRVLILRVGLIIQRLGVIIRRRIMMGVIFLRRIMTPGHYSTGVIIRRYTGRFTKCDSLKSGDDAHSH